MTQLTKGQSLELPPAGSTRLRMGVSWDKAPTAGFNASGAPDFDLDAAALQFAGTELFDLAFFNHLQTRDGSVVHQGDNLSGRGTGDDETILVDLAKVYDKVTSIFFVVTSFQGHSLQWVDNAFCRLVDDEQGTELASLRLVLDVDTTGAALARLSRDAAGSPWRLHAVDEGIDATDPTKAVRPLQRLLAAGA